jgi:hypothetical protein
MHGLWEEMYSARWPAFHDAFRFNGTRNWCRLYEDMIYSRCCCQLEIFEREKKLGFDMAAMPAIVSYEGKTDKYVVKYISASEVGAEIIPSTENYRLRFCPISGRQQLHPFFSHVEQRKTRGEIGSRAMSGYHSKWLRSLAGRLRRPARSGGVRTSEDDLPVRSNDFAQVACPARQNAFESRLNPEVDRNAYPYRVFEGFDGLVIGEHVELQWKMQELSPFGWWFGKLESLQRDPNAKTAIGTITFAHFPEDSSWYRLKVRFGDAEVRPCSFGGFSGGIRPVSDAEKTHWMRFLPQSAKHVAEMHQRLHHAS